MARVPDPNLVTSSWIYSNDKYQSWLCCTAPTILCLHGRPGSGKSVLSSLILKNIRASSFGQLKAIIFFSCDEQDERRHSTKNLLSSLVRQLLVQQPWLFNVVRGFHKSTKDRSNWTKQELWVLFRGILSSRDQFEIVCIIDGLDKCEPSHIEFWEDLVNFTTTPEVTVSPLRFIITTRRRLESTTLSGSCFFIDMDAQQEVQAETNDVIAVGVSALIRKRVGFAGFREKITTSLLNSPNPTYLTARLSLGDLEDLRVPSTPCAIGETLNSLPFMPEETYKRQLQSIPSIWHSWAHEVLSWVLYTVRPLTAVELAIALAIKTDSKSMASIEDHISRDIEGDLKEVFGSFISIENGEVHLVHPTARDFLVSLGEGNSLYILNAERAHGLISRVCLTYLSMEDILKEPEDTLPTSNVDAPAQTLQPQWDFRSYTVQYWPTHYRRTDTGEPGILLQVSNFLNDQARVGPWLKLYWSMVGAEACQTWEAAIHIASGLGLTEVTMGLLNAAAGGNDEVRGEALKLAAEGGYTILVKQLLETGTSEDTMAQIGIAFNEAVRNGHEAVVKLLLESGYNLEPVNASDINPLLHRAAKRGHVAVVKQLLEHKAEPQPDDFEHTPLHFAARSGNLNIVQQLLTAGASIDPSDTDDYTPLHYASKNGHQFVVGLLLSYGASVGEVNTKSNTPLHLAAENGHVEVVKQLLNAGANGELRNKDGETPLHLAAESGGLVVVEHLLESGVDINTARSRDRWTALHLCAYEGHVEEAKLLLRAGASVDSKNQRDSTPLFLAAQEGKEGMVKLLLGNGSSPEVTNDSMSTPLHRASQNGHLGIVKLLLNAGASPTAKKANGLTPLALAEVFGHSLIAEVLSMKSEAEAMDVNHRDVKGRTRLFYACAGGSMDEVETLLKEKADPTVKDNEGRIPLDVALDPSIRTLLVQYIEHDGHNDGYQAKTLDGAPPCQRRLQSGGEYLSCDHCSQYIGVITAVLYYRK